MVWMESSKCGDVGSDLAFGQNMHARMINPKRFGYKVSDLQQHS